MVAEFPAVLGVAKAGETESWRDMEGRHPGLPIVFVTLVMECQKPKFKGLMTMSRLEQWGSKRILVI